MAVWNGWAAAMQGIQPPAQPGRWWCGPELRSTPDRTRLSGVEESLPDLLPLLLILRRDQEQLPDP
jgi:hypothetical protein